MDNVIHVDDVTSPATRAAMPPQVWSCDTNPLLRQRLTELLIPAAVFAKPMDKNEDRKEKIEPD